MTGARADVQIRDVQIDEADNLAIIQDRAESKQNAPLK
jgi:hypothetical protein